MTKPLSPAAQAIYNAAHAADSAPFSSQADVIAAALHAVADHLVKECPWPGKMESIGSDWAHDEIRAIATELVA